MTDNTLKTEETYYPNSTQIKSRICRNAQGQLHNPHGPANQSWFSNGQLDFQEFWLNGELHNPNGPAVEHWYEDGQPAYQEFWLNDEELTGQDWKVQTQMQALPSLDGKVIILDGVEYILTKKA